MDMLDRLKICVLGREDPYTAMVVKCLRARNLNFSLVLEGGSHARSRTERLLELPLVLYRALTSGRYKPLPMLSWFKIRAFVGERFFYRSRAARSLLDPLNEVAMHGIAVPSINHVRTLKLIEREQFDIGLLAGVDIVDSAIIDAFRVVCLNAHPAPLPQCRGGGALVNTLNQGLHPAASVHVATAEVDKGEILRVIPLQLRKDDCYDSVTLRLAFLCADSLAEVALDVSSGKLVKGVPNNGQLHYWKDCTLERQRAAINKLQQMLEEL